MVANSPTNANDERQPRQRSGTPIPPMIPARPPAPEPREAPGPPVGGGRGMKVGPRLKMFKNHSNDQLMAQTMLHTLGIEPNRVLVEWTCWKVMNTKSTQQWLKLKQNREQSIELSKCDNDQKSAWIVDVRGIGKETFSERWTIGTYTSSPRSPLFLRLSSLFFNSPITEKNSK